MRELLQMKHHKVAAYVLAQKDSTFKGYSPSQQ